MKRRAVAALFAAAVTILVVRTTATPSAGCAAAAQPSFGDESFSRVEDRLSSISYPPLRAFGTEVADGAAVAREVGVAVPTRVPGGRKAQLALRGYGDGTRDSLAIYYSVDALAPSATFVDLLRASGIAFVVQPSFGLTADAVVGNVGDRAARLSVGPYDAAIVHADPVESNELRFYELHWSDSNWDFVVFGSAPATDVIDVARWIYCS